MIDVKRAFKRMMDRYTYEVKATQGYDSLHFEFETIEGASGFAQMCLEHSIPNEKGEAEVTITLKKVVDDDEEEEKQDTAEDENEKEATES